MNLGVSALLPSSEAEQPLLDAVTHAAAGPMAWDPGSAVVVALVADLQSALETMRYDMGRRMLVHLINVAESDGVLPNWGSSLNMERLGRLAGVNRPALLPGATARTVLDMFAHRFWIGAISPHDRPSSIGRSLAGACLTDQDLAREPSSPSALHDDGQAPEGTGRCFDNDGGCRIPGVDGDWDVSSAEVGKLLSDLRVALAMERLRQARRVLEYLVTVAEADGVLPGYLHGLNYRRIAILAGVTNCTTNYKGMGRKHLDAFESRFRVRAVRLDRDGNEAPKTLADRVRDWLATNPVVPSRGPTLVSLRGVAEILEIPYAAIAENAQFANLIREAIREERATLDPEPWRPAGEAADLVGGLVRAEADERIAELKAIVNGLAKVPEDYRRRGWVDFEYIAELTGRREPTMEDVPSYRRWVNAQARAKGTLLPGLLEFVDTVAAFRDWGKDQIEKELRAKGNTTWSAEVANKLSAYKKLIDAAGLEPSDEIGDLFGEGYPDLVEKALGGLKGESAANVRRGLKKWRELRERKLGLGGQTLDFAESLRMLMRARGVTARAVAAELGMNPGTLASWWGGQGSPSSASLADVRRLEDFFKQPRGKLLDTIRHTQITSFTKADATDEFKALSWEVKQLLPDTASDWAPDVLASAVETVKPLLTAGTQQGNHIKLAMSEDYLLAPYDPNTRLVSELDAFVDYKTVAVPYPYLRAKKGRWASENSEKMRLAKIETFFRFMAHPRSGGAASGMGINRDLATIAWIGHAPMTLAFAGHQAYRFHDEDWGLGKRGIFYTAAHEQFVEMAASMTHPKTGWLAQNPQLAGTLRPLDAQIPKEFSDLLKLYADDEGGALLGAEDVAFAQRDWLGYMERNHNALVQAANHLKDAKRVSRDPLTPLTGLFKSTTPSADLFEAVIRSEGYWRSARTSPLLHGVDVRDSVMVRLETIVNFRPKNMAGLTYFPNQSGQIRKRDGLWEIEIPFDQFKNWKNCRLFGPRTSRRNYHIILPDEANLYGLLDYYFFEARNQLPLGDDTRGAFVTQTGEDVKPYVWANIAADFGRHHLAWNPVKGTGIPGVASLNAYGFRHIKASDILQNSTAYNKVEEAAFALQTSETMIIDHYGLLLPNAALVSALETNSKSVEIALERLRASGHVARPFIRFGT